VYFTAENAEIIKNSKIKDRQMIIAQFGVFIFISVHKPILEHIF